METYLEWLDAQWTTGKRNSTELWRRLRTQGFCGSRRGVWRNMREMYQIWVRANFGHDDVIARLRSSNDAQYLSPILEGDSHETL
ncbi:hypothetical protein, partial [Rhizobium sp. BK650]|uniref:hypothetical protein n=1 Tax=Rhizobium sp. BK650 TaxID=2586990 RepID=UPI001AEEA94A